MARRSISRAGGFVHDVAVVAFLSGEQTNLRVLSDKTLYILQNLSSEDVTFLSRYGEILGGDLYLPVLSGTPDEATVDGAVDLIRRDLNDMSFEEMLECICSSTRALVEQSVLDGQAVEDVSSDGDVPVGPGEQFETQTEYLDAKCNVANGLFDTILGGVEWLDDNNVNLLLGLFGGVTAGLISGLIAAGPFGWAVVLVASTTAGIAAYIFRFAVSFSNLVDALDDTHTECVMALFNASNSAVAENNFIVAVEAGTPTITAVESGLLSLMITSDMLNQLFAPRSDLTSYESPSPVDCGSGLLQSWSFVASGETWSFRDDSTGGYSASGVWSSGLEAWEITIVGPGSGTGPRADGTVLITGLSIAIPAGGSIQMDYSATGDGVIAGRKIKAFFSDATDQTEAPPGTSSAGTTIMTVPLAKTINSIEITVGRNWTIAFNTTRAIEEVRVFGV